MRLIFALFFMAFSAEAKIRIYGDSIFTTRNHAVKQELEQMIGEEITDLAEYGDWISGIVDAYQRQPAEPGDIVIFDGGGNDILWNAWTCKGTPQESCKERVNGVAESIASLLYRMEQDGVASAIYLGVHYPSGMNAGFNQIIDYSYPVLIKTCEASPICLGVADTRSRITSTDLEWDGIHPNPSGARVIAEEIYKIYSVKKAMISTTE